MDPAASFPRLSGRAEVSVRPARPEDAAEIARVQAVTWRTAYGTVLPRDVLDTWDDRAAEDAWAAAVTRPPTPGHGVVVAVERDAVVGFAAYGPADRTDAGEPPGAGPMSEIAVLLVEPRWGRRGHGSRLLAAVADLTASSGAAGLEVWLAESDTASARFFESAGWAPDGWSRTLETGSAPLRELRWHTELSEDAPGSGGVR